MRGTRLIKLAVAAIIACLSVATVAYAGSRPARLKAHSVYGGLTAKKDAFVDLRTASATVIAASPANTAPEKRQSNINLTCANKAQVNPGMIKLKLKRKRGHYSFSRSFTRTGVKETEPGSGSVTLKVTISGTVRNAKTISGRVKVTGPHGCSVPSQAYTAKLSS
jgi:hypothetical protein